MLQQAAARLSVPMASAYTHVGYMYVVCGLDMLNSQVHIQCVPECHALGRPTTAIRLNDYICCLCEHLTIIANSTRDQISNAKDVI
jgi:hypothetical protein